MLTVPEAARRAGKNPETIRRWIREGRLSSRRVGTQYLIEPGDLATMVGSVGAHRIGDAHATYGAVAPSAIPIVESVPNEWLPAIVGRIVRATDPRRIVVVGERSRSHVPLDDDYELIVAFDVMRDRFATTIAVRRAFEDIPAPAEITVMTTAEADTDPGSWLVDSGRVVYDRRSVD